MIRDGLRHDACLACGASFSQPAIAEPFERELFCTGCREIPPNEPPPPTPVNGWLHPARYQSHDAIVERAAAGDIRAQTQLAMFDDLL